MTISPRWKDHPTSPPGYLAPHLPCPLHTPPLILAPLHPNAPLPGPLPLHFSFQGLPWASDPSVRCYGTPTNCSSVFTAPAITQALSWGQSGSVPAPGPPGRGAKPQVIGCLHSDVHALDVCQPHLLPPKALAPHTHTSQLMPDSAPGLHSSQRCADCTPTVCSRQGILPNREDSR